VLGILLLSPAIGSCGDAIGAAVSGSMASGGNHEPSGMVVVGPGVNPMSALPPLTPDVDAWGQRYWPGQLQSPWGQGAQNLNLASEAQLPFSPNTFYRLTFPLGFTGGDAPARWSLAGGFPVLNAPLKRMYVSFWIRHSAAYQGSSKLFFFSQRDGNNHYLILSNRVDKGYEAVIQNQGINFERVAAPMANIHQWNFVELLLQAGDAGSHNGIGQLWVNGSLLLERTDFQFFTSGVDASWDHVWMDPTYGGPAVANEWLDLGHVYVSVGTDQHIVFANGFE
jgi:hypothetical protein